MQFTGTTTNYGTVSTDTIISIKGTNSGGGPGGFVGTFVITNDDDGTTTSISTSQDTIEKYFTVYADDGVTEVTIDTYYLWGSISWWQSAQPQGVDTENAYWARIPHLLGYYFVFDLAGLESVFTDLGCFASVTSIKQHTAGRNRNGNSNKDGNTFTYQRNQKQFEINHNNKIISNVLNQQDADDAFGAKYMELFGVFSLVLILGAGGIYYRSRKKSNEYISLKDSSEISSFSRANYQSI